MTAASQWEREAIGERTRDAMHHKRANGERVGTVPVRLSLSRRRLAVGSGPCGASNPVEYPRAEDVGLHYAADRGRAESAGFHDSAWDGMAVSVRGGCL